MATNAFPPGFFTSRTIFVPSNPAYSISFDKYCSYLAFFTQDTALDKQAIYIINLQVAETRSCAWILDVEMQLY